jgi:hypothetical protein
MFDVLLERAKFDVDIAIRVWKEIIEERLDGIEYAYVKGSAVKKWDSLLDYVPIISDIDIHIKMEGYNQLFNKDRSGFKRALDITGFYENKFKELNNDFLHVPRPQIVVLEEVKSLWDPYESGTFRVLYGNVKNVKSRNLSEIRQEDLSELIQLKSVLDEMPQRIIDRIGLEYYRILREICWRISPAPYRLLSQTLNPRKVWRMNRTQINDALEEEGYKEIHGNYYKYYIMGWKAFETGFLNNSIMREIISKGYKLLYSIHRKAMAFN